MTLAGNVSGSLQSTIPDDNDFVTNGPRTNISEEEQYLKDALASYRRIAHVATCIHAAFGEQSFKLNKDGEEDEKQENIGEERFFQASIKQAEERAERSVIQYSCKVAMISVFGEKLEANEIGGLKRLYHCIEKRYNSMPLDLPRTPFKKVIKPMNDLSRLGIRKLVTILHQSLLFLLVRCFMFRKLSFTSDGSNEYMFARLDWWIIVFGCSLSIDNT
nr:abscisic acid 8'-hydroxylase 2-like [Tanacetum cinerariifolium]